MPPQQNMMDVSSSDIRILIDNTKKEPLLFPDGFKKMEKELKRWNVSTHEKGITTEILKKYQIFVALNPREKFTETEFHALEKFIEEGHSVFLTLHEGGDNKYDTNLNYFLEKFGISWNNDAVVRTSYYKYFHPKEALIPNGIVNRKIGEYLGKIAINDDFGGGGDDDDYNKNNESVRFVYPYGSTLVCQNPAATILSSGSVCYPLSQPICAVHGYDDKSSGKLVVLGSTKMLSDQYIDKEENKKILDFIINFLLGKIDLNEMDANDPNIGEYVYIPDIAYLSETVKTCLQDTDQIPRDFTKLFDHKLFTLNTSLVPTVIECYKDLHVEHTPLTLIPPEFETPQMDLQLATFPPQFRDLPGPSLDLFDLDEQFSSEKTRLAVLTNRSKKEKSLEHFIREAGEMMGIMPQLPEHSRTAKHVLAYIFREIAEFKKSEVFG
ncbi:hypothetical protein SNEBB_004348 [Seison nebaliae]|nr:hypothetical protein SNEBB_004348 [Seison nebaliae]